MRKDENERKVSKGVGGLELRRNKACAAGNKKRAAKSVE